LRRTSTNLEVVTARQLVVLACAAAGVPALDMITPDFKDLARTTREATEARTFGFTGKMCIHPRQLPVVHEVFRPTDAELAWARRVVEAFSGSGVSTLDGKMIDKPVVDRARRLLARVGEA